MTFKISNLKSQFLNKYQRNQFIGNLKLEIGNDGRGFTLIELLIVFSVLAILSTVGIASFVDYSRTQTVNQAANDLVTTLGLARSRAFSQVKPSDVRCNTFTGYRIGFCAVDGNACQPSDSSESYALYPICDGSTIIGSTGIVVKKFPAGVSFSGSNPSSLTFTALNSGVIGASSTGTDITITGFNKTVIITIYNDGKVYTH